MPGLLAQHRRRFINAGVEDTLRWCAHPDATVIGNHHTDQFWIQVFAPTAAPISAHTARWFLRTLKLAGDWDYEAVATLINDLRTAAVFRPHRDIPALAIALRQLQQDPDLVCTPAMSKLAQLVFLDAEVYVWQEPAWQSVLARRQHPLSGMALQNAPDWYASAHDYAAYHVECQRIFEREMARADFVEAADLVIGLLRTISGPLADAAIPDAFFQRYLLGKMLFHEGWHMKFGRVANCEFESTPVDTSLRPGLYQRLRSYVRLSGTEASA